MKAAILKEIGKQLIVEEIVEPALLVNAVKIKILSAHILFFSATSPLRTLPHYIFGKPVSATLSAFFIHSIT